MIKSQINNMKIKQIRKQIINERKNNFKKIKAIFESNGRNYFAERMDFLVYGINGYASIPSTTVSNKKRKTEK